ncbi:MAG: hypothetical protein JSU91_06145 [Thermoplasmatales archaeon]|nr:MAG: hypothetical protein JSU91_06145 [Thermoplasmatales archaeon]
MKKDCTFKIKNLIQSTRVVIVLLIVIILISGSTISVNIKKQNISITNEPVEFKEVISSGLAPYNELFLETSSEKSNIFTENSLIAPLDEIMYGYRADPDPEAIIYFNVWDPGYIEEIAPSESENFLSGGTWVWECYGRWIACQNDNGALWEIDHETGDMTYIGGGGVGLNGLTYNVNIGVLYGASDSDFYEIDVDNGVQTLIGAFGEDVNSMIGIACDSEGRIYGWDLGDKFWIIDTETGEAELIGPLGIDINYAQDGDIHKESDTLYLTAYTTTGQLYTVDKETGVASFIDDFEDGAQITASVIPYDCPCSCSDIGIKSIDYPESGYAIEENPMQVTVKNYGNNTETTDVQMKVTKYEAGPVIFEEDFSDAFPPEGWETDFWSQNHTNISGGQSPEAGCYKYTQYNQGDYYDNFIQSAPINCTGLDRVNIRFRWATDFKYPQYPSIFVKIRIDSTSPWQDVTPWDNPVGENQNAQLWEINCYSLDKPLGDEFQIKWEYIGYYYYFNHLWLDEIEIINYIATEDYNVTIKDLEIKYGEELIVEFPTWTSPNWQDPEYENIWNEYKVRACTLFEDETPKNDCKIKIINLYYPWLHDIELKRIDSPCEDGSGKTYPVQATIKNIGQYAECCIPIDIKISEISTQEILLMEDSWNTVPPTGWYDEHKDFDPNYGWKKSYTFYSGGFYPEAYISYTYCLKDYVFYSYPIDISNYSNLRLQFKTYIDHHSGEGLYALESGYSTDNETWHVAWHKEPSSDEKSEVDILFQVESETIYIGFWVMGNPYYLDNWYIDDVQLKSISFVEEYSDFACQGPEIEPGEEVNFTFEDWTPNFLQYEITGTKDYIVETEIAPESDINPKNDIKSEQFNLNYWHDVGIDEITSPVGEGHPREGDKIIWDNGEPDGRNALPGSMYQGYCNILIDDFQNEDDWNVQGGAVHILWNSGYTSNTETIRVYFYKDEGECDPSQDEFPEPDMYFEAVEFTEYTTGNYYFSRPEVVVDFLLGEEATIPPGKWYVGIQPEGYSQDIAYILTAADKGCMCMADLPYWGYPRWSSSQYLWGQAYDLSFEIHGFCCGRPSPNAWIQPGIKDIDAVVKNYGTFKEEDLICYAKIREYITDPYNGTQVYSDEISNVDLSEPLGGEIDLEFADYSFPNEGRYGLFLELPASPDDNSKNNEKAWIIAVDDTKPESDYPPILDPECPDGLNGWYVSDVTVTLNASDPWSKGVSSGIKEIRYTINGGAEQVIPGNQGSFVLTQDGDDILVEYWAIDWVGNIETQINSFNLDIDQKVPVINLDYEVTSGNPLSGWKLTFTATATDETSKMDNVEFYLNDLYQETVTGPGPNYEWSYTYYGGLSMIITAIAYDKAGNYNSDYIEDPTICTSSNPKSNQIYKSTIKNLNIPFMR